jgi:hypothetical protein
MPIQIGSRWYEDVSVRPDYAFFYGIYDASVRALLDHFYEQHLLFRIWSPDFAIKAALLAAGELRVDERLEEFCSLNGLASQKLELPIVGEVDGRVFATPSLVAYFGWRENGGANNPAGIVLDVIWRRG